MIAIKFKPDVKEKFLAALRSGEYPKTKGALRTNNGCFCVEGVLADLYATENNKQWVYSGLHHGRMLVDGETTATQILENIWFWATGNRYGPIIKLTVESPISGSLIYINDMTDLTFPEIADLIEKQA